MNTIKIPTTTYPIHDLIKTRWSPRAFKEQAITDALMEQLFEAASWSFSANNAQPWVYIYAHRADTANFERLAACLSPFNRTWADRAAVLVLSAAITGNAEGAQNPWALHDLGAANMSLLLEANANGILGHLMAGFDVAKAATTFELPAHIQPHVMIALGYEGDPDTLVEDMKKRELMPRVRKPLAQVAAQGALPILG